MSLRSAMPASIRSRPLVAEIGVVVGLLAGISVWRRVLTALQPRLVEAVPDGMGDPVGGFLVGGAFLVGLVLYAGVYARLRGVAVGLSLPSSADRRHLGMAAVVPLGLVALTKLAGVLTGVPYNALTMSAYGADTPPTAFLSLVGPGLVVAAICLAIVCQVLVQGTFQRVAGGRSAIALTTALTAVVLTSATGGVTPTPHWGKLLGAVAFVCSLGVALYAIDHVDRGWMQYLAYVPVTSVVGLVVISWIAETGTVAELLFGATHVAVLALAAAGYERTESLLVPAVAYLSLLVGNEAVVFVFEAGMQSW
ncbi:MAG: hypothetical protein ABEJ73_06525 [Haloplanus sp.]